ncbi:MAG: HD domain-containing phosphohydrolase [Planctomycetota bacterium]
MSEQVALQPVPLAITETLTPEEASSLPIYLPGPPNKPPVLYREPGHGLCQPNIDKLRESGVPTLFVRSEDLPQCERALEEKLGELIRNPNIAPEQKAACVKTVGTSVVKALLNSERPCDQVDRASLLIVNMVDVILSDRAVAASLLHMSAHHRSTASHMFAVSYLSILLGAEVLGPESDELAEVGMAGMLHDLGKIKIPERLLNKTSPLSPEELQLIHHHPIESVRMIGNNPEVSARVRQMILQHHERPDGRGYPLGLADGKLLVGSKIVTIVDVFHALIGPRTYRDAISPVEAIRFQALRAGRKFDSEIFSTWKGLFESYWGVIQRAPQWEEAEPDVGRSFHSDHQLASTQDTPRRNLRLRCDGNASVKCIYVGRLCQSDEVAPDFTAQLHDLSKSGFCLYSSHPMYRGEVVHSLIGSSEDEVWVRGVVRWCKHHEEGRHYRVGVQFQHRITTDDAQKKTDVLSLDDPHLFPVNKKFTEEDSAE